MAAAFGIRPECWASARTQWSANLKSKVTAQVPPERSGYAESADQRLRILGQSVNDVPALLPGGRDEGADHGEVASPLLRAVVEQIDHDRQEAWAILHRGRDLLGKRRPGFPSTPAAAAA